MCVKSKFICLKYKSNEEQWLIQTEIILRAIWNAAINADNCGFSQQPVARLCSICAILMSKQLITRGGSSTEI